MPNSNRQAAEPSLDRRQFLKTVGKTIAGAALATGGLSFLAEGSAYGQSSSDLDRYDFLMPRVKFTCGQGAGDRWCVTPGGDRNLLLTLRDVVRCKVKLSPNCRDYDPRWGDESHFNAVVDLTGIEQMRKYPFLFMTADCEYELSDKKKANLGQYINEGGFLLMDDCVVGEGGDFFYQSSYRILEEIFGPGSVKRIPRDHEIFHNVYDLGDIGLPHLQGQNHGARGIFIGDRLAAFLSSNDIHCGWGDGQRVWFGRGGIRGTHTYKEAIQMGINIIMYAISH